MNLRGSIPTVQHPMSTTDLIVTVEFTLANTEPAEAKGVLRDFVEHLGAESEYAGTAYEVKSAAVVAA